MIFPIAYGNTRVHDKFPSVNEKSLYVWGTFKSMEEKSYTFVWDIYDYFLQCIKTGNYLFDIIHGGLR